MRMLLVLVLLFLCVGVAFSQSPVSTPIGDTIDTQQADDLEAILSVPTADAKTWEQAIIEWLIAGISIVGVAFLALGKNLWSEGGVLGNIALLGTTVAINLARLTKSPDDETQIEKAINEGGGLVEKDGIFWKITPMSMQSLTADEGENKVEVNISQ